MAIEWINPPDSTAGPNSAIAVEVEELKQAPGRWARVVIGCEHASRAKTWTKYGCEVTTRSRKGENGTRLFDIYARWPADDA